MVLCFNHAVVRLAAADRRKTFVDAAIEVIRDRGFANATTRDVAARLGVGRGLLHHYFSSWEELQRAAFEALTGDMQATADRALAPLAPAARVAALLDFMLAEPDDPHWQLYADAWDEAQRDPELARLYAGVMAGWRGRCEQAIRAGVATGAFTCADPAAAAWRLSALCDGLSGYVLLAEAGLSRAVALQLLEDAMRLELRPKPQA